MKLYLRKFFTMACLILSAGLISARLTVNMNVQSSLAGGIVDLTGLTSTTALADTLPDVASGAVILLKPGMTYTTGGYKFDKSVEIRSADLSSPDLPKIDCTSNFHVLGGATVDSVIFKNLSFFGTFDDRYVFNPNESAAITVGEIRFDGCRISHLRGIARFRGPSPGVIRKFTVTNCVVDSIRDYAVFCTDTDNGIAVDDIVITKSTFSKCRNFLISRMQSKSVLIDQCTISEVPSTGSNYMFRWRGGAGNADITNGLTIRNTIWGHAWDEANSGGYAIRGHNGSVSLAATTITIEEVYSTSQFAFGTGYELTGFPVGNYTGTDADLWVSPFSGLDFHIKDASFAGKNNCGDPRWLPAKKKVGYILKAKTMNSSAAPAEGDPIYKILKADPKLEVIQHVLTDVSAAATVDLSGYDVVVIQESFGGGDAILTPAGALALTKLTKPTVYNKTYAFKKGRALTEGGSATGTETPGIYNITVDTLNQTNPLFKGIKFSNNEAKVFETGSDDFGLIGSSTKALNYTTGLEMTPANPLLAVPAGITVTPSLFINDIPAATSLGGEVIPARMIALGMNFGAICASKGKNITAEGLTIWRNAVYVLAGLEVPSAIVDLSSTLDTIVPSAGKLAPAFSGKSNAFTLNLPAGTKGVSFTALPTVSGADVTLPGTVALNDGDYKSVQIIGYNVPGSDSTVYTIDVHVATPNEILFVGGSNDVPLSSSSSLKQDRKTFAMLRNAGYSVTYVYKWGVTKSYIGGVDFDYSPYKAVVFGASAPSDGTKSYAMAGYPVPCVSLQKDGGRYNKWGWVANAAAQYTEKKITALAAENRVPGLKMKVANNTHYITSVFGQNNELTWCAATADSTDFTKIVLPEYNLKDSLPDAVPLMNYVGGTAGLSNLWAVPPGGKVKTLQPDGTTYAKTEIKNRIVLLSVQSDAMLYPTLTFDTLLIRSLEWVLGATTYASEIAIHDEILVYPNPVKDFVKLRFSAMESGFADVSLMNINGQKVASIAKRALYKGINEIEMITRGLPEGIYIYQLKTGEKLFSGKLSISR